MATQSWFDIFPQCTISNAIASRFENSWLEEPDISHIVEQRWTKWNTTDFISKLKHCSNDIDVWGKHIRTRFRTPITDCRRKLMQLRDKSDATSNATFLEIQDKLNTLILQEEAFWKQRAKVHWLKEGDSNSKFFHATASARRKRNYIQSIINEEGQTITNQNDIEITAHLYFETLFRQQESDITGVINHIPTKITEEDNNKLLNPFSLDEFRVALFSMHADKSPGPDGLNPGCYKRFWYLLGPVIYQASNQWLEPGSFPPQLNHTNIVLILKIDHPTSMKDYRPISLCSVLYKVITKVLANRLKPLLPECGSISF
uniref:Transposon TX1 uncharacterized n=1 Tax=Cajanus cajan TaxID=3821 RepID=A0A151RAJ1_CAJCA|nr:Transposon TX1 uncharacterized [Cajanus cajan]